MVDEKAEAPADNWQPFSCVPPETPTEAMEFLARSWSLSAMEVSKVLAKTGHMSTSTGIIAVVPQPSAASFSAESEHQKLQKSGVVSPPVSPRDSEEMKGTVRGRAMGRWLVKDQKERKKQEIRTHNAQLHAAVSVAGVASAVAAVLSSSSTASSSVASRRSQHLFPAAAAALVASHCIGMAEDMGAEHEHILAAVKSAVSARNSGDIMTLTAAAATALRGAAALRARMLPIVGQSGGGEKMEEMRRDVNMETALKFVRRGGELLKRTRKGALHWKQVSVHMNSNWQVVAKLKSKYMGGTFIKKNKFVVSDVCCDIRTWPGRDCDGVGVERAYFGVLTLERVIEFECKSEREKEMWTDGIQQMLNCQKNMPLPY